MNAARILSVYRLTFSVLIVIASVQTLVSERGPGIVLLASSEIGGALLLSWRRSQWIGVAVLLLVFGAAQAMAAAAGLWPTRFLQYAASALVIIAMDRALAEAR